MSGDVEVPAHSLQLLLQLSGQMAYSLLRASRWSSSSSSASAFLTTCSTYGSPLSVRYAPTPRLSLRGNLSLLYAMFSPKMASGGASCGTGEAMAGLHGDVTGTDSNDDAAMCAVIAFRRLREDMKAGNYFGLSFGHSNPTDSCHVLLAILLCAAQVAAKAPDTSLSTTPVVYYGANWNRSQLDIDILARFQMVVLMQEDGHCWATCCPRRFEASSQCGWEPGDPAATTHKGCDAGCNEHGSQEDVFKRIAASARRQKLTGPHAVLYMNCVYLCPFDEASALGEAAMVTDINGRPHQESCDPGIFPSYFFDFGKPAGAKAWLNIIQKHVVEGATDGVYCDCCGLVPFHCTVNGTCTAKRNGKKKSINEEVTQATVDAHIKGKNATLHEAIRLVTDVTGNRGTFFNKVHNKDFSNKGNINWVRPAKPPQLHRTVKANIAVGNYVVVGGSNDFSNPKHETPAAGQNLSDGRSLQTCNEDTLAQFLLAVEPGTYLLCNGWDSRLGRPLGLPVGPASNCKSMDGTSWSRSFKSGVVATCDNVKNEGVVIWGHSSETSTSV